MGVKKQLNEISEYGKANLIKYNPDKPFYMSFCSQISKKAKDRIADSTNPLSLRIQRVCGIATVKAKLNQL